ncbi:MAG: 16S rRNA (guanine(966)-N(2))-methyltransferase RsmD [Thermoanaerobaculia bacterium]
MTRRSGVRISGGRFRGRSLPVPATARPTSARLREALFDIWRDRVPGARFLDLFAGSGAVGLEALSRGASFVVFVENDRDAVRRLQAVCAELAPDSTSVLQADLPAQIDRVQRPGEGCYDLIFADPPYAFTEYGELVASLGELLAVGGELAIEHSVRRGLPDSVEGLVRQGSRNYGENRIAFFAAAPGLTS